MIVKTSKYKSNSQGRPPKNKNKDKREHILDNALTLFAGQGIVGTTVAQIAKASGVTPAMVHYYFVNRKGLLDALVAERLAKVLEYIWAGVSEETLSEPRLIVTEFVDRLLEIVDRMPQLPLLWSREILNAGGFLRDRVISFVPLDKFERVRSAFAEAQLDGRVNPGVDPDLVIISTLSIVMVPLAAQDIISKVSVLSTINKPLLRQHALALILNGLCPNDDPKGQQ